MTRQPRPKPTREDRTIVGPIARDLFLSMIDGRTRLGIDRYGEPLTTHSGRNAFRDAMEEAVDLWQYLVQARLEFTDIQEENRLLKQENAALQQALHRLQTCSEESDG